MIRYNSININILRVNTRVRVKSAKFFPILHQHTFIVNVHTKIPLRKWALL